MRQRFWQWGMVAIVALLMSPYVILAFNTFNRAQDYCEFGHAPAVQTRNLLNLAVAKHNTEWQPIHARIDRSVAKLQVIIAMRIEARISDLAPTGSSPAARIAAMHAVLRQLGAIYWQTWNGREDPFGDGLAGPPISFVHYTYYLDVHRLFDYSPIYRDALISVGFDWSVNTPAIQVSVVWPSLLERWPKRGIPPLISPDCPLVPSDSWVQSRQVNRKR